MKGQLPLLQKSTASTQSFQPFSNVQKVAENKLFQSIRGFEGRSYWAVIIMETRWTDDSADMFR